MNENLAPYTKIQNMVFREIDKVKNHFNTGEDKLGPDGYVKWSSGRTTMVRFDSDIDENLDYTSRVNLTMRYIENDLLDLVWDGDVNNTQDAFLKACNGYRVLKERGKEIVDFEIASASLYQTYNHKKKLYEYTLYCVLFINTIDI